MKQGAMKYISVAELAKIWGVSERTIRNYCAQGKIQNAFLTGKTWNIPSDAERPCRTHKCPSQSLLGRLQDEKAGIDSRSECADSVFRFLKTQDADIICLQEFHAPDAQKVKAYIDRHMRGYHAEYYMFPTRNGAFGNVTLSRMPVKEKGKIKFDESANLAIYTDYELDGQRFRVYNCHFESYNVSVSGLVRGLVQRDSLLISTTGDKMKRSITRRPKQVDQVFAHIEKCPVETFVCGDFNDNPMSYTYYRMTRGRKDTFKEAGNGFGATFATLWPMLRIDYILCPKAYKPVSHKTHRINLSDHYPVVSTICM